MTSSTKVTGAVKPTANKGAKAPKAILSAASPRQISEDSVRERAYLKWEQAGCPLGDGVNFWLEAEAELQSEING